MLTAWVYPHLAGWDGDFGTAISPKEMGTSLGRWSLLWVEAAFVPMGID